MFRYNINMNGKGDKQVSMLSWKTVKDNAGLISAKSIGSRLLVYISKVISQSITLNLKR